MDKVDEIGNRWQCGGGRPLGRTVFDRPHHVRLRFVELRVEEIMVRVVLLA